MLATLLESRRSWTWPVGNGALSLFAHVVVVGLTTAYTGPSASDLVRDTDTGEVVAHTLRFVSVTPAEEDAARRGTRGAASAARRARTLVAPSAVPLTLPDVPAIDPDALRVDLEPLVDDLLHVVSRADDFGPPPDGRSFASRMARRVPANRAPGTPYYATEVERMAVAAPGNPVPRYPPSLLSAGVQGDVVVQFVVDSTGSADPRSLRILRSSHELFTRSVRAVLPKMRFLPAEIGGARVGMLVEQPFVFTVR